MRHPDAEPHTFALLQWPAVLGLLAFDGLLPRMVCGLWLVLMLAAAYRGGRGIGFGNAMLLQCGLVALAWQAHPSPWAYAWLAPIPLLMLAAQQLRRRAAA